MIFKKDDVIFLLGAGASFDAGIPISSMMIEDVEKLVTTEAPWKKYKDLYNLVKSAIIYADGVQGKFGKNVVFNIERLFNVLIELEKKEEHPLYPFIGQWNIKFSEIVNNNYKIISDFQELILNKLKEWVSLDKNENADYYKSLKFFRLEYTFPLRIFTLNYDLCVEKSLTDINIERGFNEDGIWDYRKYTDVPEGEDRNDIYLYKLHGSIDWERNTETGEVSFKDEISRIRTPDLIFGDIYKLQYVDPYLFQFYELRRHSLQAKLIIIIGYSFADEHINEILSQSLKQDITRKILIISPDAIKETVKKILNPINQNQIDLRNISAKDFFENKIKLINFDKLFSEETEEDLW